MRMGWKLWAISALLSAPVIGLAATCTPQAEMQPQDRNTLSAVALRLAAAVEQQDFTGLQAALLPAEAPQWDSIRGAAELAVPLMTGGQPQVLSLYLLDASTQTATEDTEFFCSNASGSMTVTASMRALPPGKYAIALAEAVGASLDGQLGIILAWGGNTDGWKLAGISAHQGSFDSHDGVWYWTRARALAGGDPWSAWYSYDAAQYLSLPVDFLSSPNLDKLRQEQAQISPAPPTAFPISLPDGDRTWKIDTVVLDASLHEPDLGVAYESTGVTDPAALHTEAITVMSAFLKAQPGIRANFHGLWAYSMSNGKRSPVMELPMAKIP